MQKRRFWLAGLAWLLIAAMLLSFAGCHPETPDTPDDPGDDPDNPEKPDDPQKPDDPNKGDEENMAKDVTVREYRVVDGDVIQPGATADLPDGLAEAINAYMTNYDAVRIDGAVTTFQTGSFYRSSQRINTEAVMAYVSSTKGIDDIIKSWSGQKNYYSINLMMPINRDSSDYVKRDPANYGDIQTDKAGKYITHSTSDSVFYMVPTEGWIEYIWEIVKTALESNHLDSITFEEPEMWYASGYSDGFKTEWENYYDEPWEDQNSSPEAMLKTMRLKVYLFDRILSEIARRAHKLAPDTKIYVASHSTASYTSIAITAGLNTYLASEEIDGVIGQTWSNTSMVAVPLNGKNVQKPFENSFLGYASYADAAGALDLYAITDTMADGNAWSEKECFPIYRDNLVAALLQPEIHRFEASVWPDRGFESVSPDYRTLQLSCFAALNEMSGKPMTVSAGTPGVAYLLSDSLSWQAGNSSWAYSSKDGYYGVTLPLVTDGIPLSIRSMERLKSAADLEGVNLLIVSWDCQKPTSEEVCTAVADWILAGGTVLYVGGHDSFETSGYEWWSDDGCPLQALISKLGLDIRVTTPAITASQKLAWVGSTTVNPIVNELTVPRSANGFCAGFEGADVSPIATLGKDGTVVGIDQAIGKGHLIAFGIPSALFAADANGAAVMRTLAAYGCDQYSEVLYVPATLLWAKRGNVIAAHSIGQENVLVGKFVDLFDPDLPILDYKVIGADDSVLLYDISGLDLSVPRLAYTGGTLLTEVQENADTTVYKLTGPTGTMISTRFVCRDGLYPQKVSAKTDRNVRKKCQTVWDNETDSLLVQVEGMIEGLNITVEWGTTPVEDTVVIDPAKDYEPTDVDYAQLYAGRKKLKIVTNEGQRTADEAFVITDTANANGSCKFCDLAMEIIYRFDLEEYPDAVVALEVAQNYVIEVSTDGKTWREIQNYEKLNGVRAQSAGNKVQIGVSAEKYAAGADEMYVRISNSDKTQGWGGAIFSFTIYY